MMMMMSSLDLLKWFPKCCRSPFPGVFIVDCPSASVAHCVVKSHACSRDTQLKRISGTMLCWRPTALASGHRIHSVWGFICCRLRFQGIHRVRPPTSTFCTFDKGNVIRRFRVRMCVSYFFNWLNFEHPHSTLRLTKNKFNKIDRQEGEAFTDQSPLHDDI